MCLAIPGIIVEINENRAMIDYDGIKKEASTRLYPQAACGDYVLVHAGFIIQVLSSDEGQELAGLNREINNNMELE